MCRCVKYRTIFDERLAENTYQRPFQSDTSFPKLWIESEPVNGFATMSIAGYALVDVKVRRMFLTSRIKTLGTHLSNDSIFVHADNI